MFDIKLVRENPEIAIERLQAKNEKGAEEKINKILELDKKRRELIVKADDLKAKKNTVSVEVGKLKKAGQDASALMNEMKVVAEEIKSLDDELSGIEPEMNNILMTLPNTPHTSVPLGKSADDNVEVRRWLPEGYVLDTEKDYTDHLEIGKRLNILDFERGTKISGSGFPLYKGKGATLERALISFMLDTHRLQNGYTEVMTPFLVNEASMRGTGQLPKMQEDMYWMERDGLYAIPTAEVPITNIHRDEVLNEDELPIKYVGYSPCFRREAGSYGKDTKGFLRVHQFNKVEMVKFVEPSTSYDELEKLVDNAEGILKELNVAYRILLLCTGDLSFSAAKCYDIETWSPAEKKWLESSSCSNFEAFQARRAVIKYRNKESKKLELVHTLNGSGLATSRLMVSLIESNYRDGKLYIPEPLQKYTGFAVIEN